MFGFQIGGKCSLSTAHQFSGFRKKLVISKCHLSRVHIVSPYLSVKIRVGTRKFFRVPGLNPEIFPGSRLEPGNFSRFRVGTESFSEFRVGTRKNFRIVPSSGLEPWNSGFRDVFPGWKFFSGKMETLFPAHYKFKENI